MNNKLFYTNISFNNVFYIFPPRGFTSGIWLYIQVWYSMFYVPTVEPIRLLIPLACKTYYTIPVYTAIFLKMNPRVSNT